MSANLCRVKRSFKPYQNERDSVKETGEKGKKNHVTLTPKFPWKSCFTHLPFLSSNSKILKAFPKTIPSKVKLNEFPAKEKKMGQEKWIYEEERKKKWKEKSKDCCATFQPKNYLEILLSAHAQSSQANILHLDQKAGKCMTCKQLCGKFYVALL